ncbi:MAG TPA: three-Cys-motif partner protein TcmP [Fibrobacteria bacterium]|nr:three-Cys-motif partner protein TcmP [Fibrobacteria bacterium]
MNRILPQGVAKLRHARELEGKIVRDNSRPRSRATFWKPLFRTIMPPKKQPTIWRAEPHTIAKISILRKYLYSWFQILGRTFRGKDIWFVDGFAGPGRYTNVPEGSPLAAIGAARQALLDAAQSWQAGKIHLVFIEENEGRFRVLQEQVEGAEKDPRIECHLYIGTFEDGMGRLQSEFKAPFSSPIPFFVFIDPFGALGAPFSLVSEILQSKSSEVLINLDADGIGRIFLAERSAGSDVLLKQIFGNDMWKSVLVREEPFDITCRKVLDLYKNNLRNLSGVKYMFSFEMRTTVSGLNYFLLFCSGHSKGLVKMKESMKHLDQDGSYRFVDSHVGQSNLLRFDDPERYAEIMWAEFGGRSVTYAEVNDWSLNETPFVNPKKMLSVLEDRDMIAVSSSDPKRRKKTFSEESIQSIHFKKRSPHG